MTSADGCDINNNSINNNSSSSSTKQVSLSLSTTKSCGLGLTPLHYTTMLTSAVCLAAVSLVLCLDLVQGGSTLTEDNPHMVQSDLSQSSPMDAPYDAAEDYGGSYGGRSMSGNGMVSDGTDMVMTRAQRSRLYGGVEGLSGRAFEKVGNTVADTWPDGVVPFVIETTLFNDFEVGLIRRGMQTWENVTCVRFVPATPDHSHRLIVHRKKGCHSALGMQRSPAQYLSMGNRCFFRSAMEHELGHTLGLIHEHQRPNRDDHLILDYNAITEKGVAKLKMYEHGSDDKYGLPYDYHSVMHYVKSAYPNEWNRQTMYPKVVNKTDVMGMAMKLSFLDIKLVNLMYSCKDRCKSPPVCQEPCFVNEHCQCFCEKDTPKEVCEDKAGPSCEDLAAEGKCITRSLYMLDLCRKYCGVCTENGGVPQLPCMDYKSTCTPESCKDAKLARSCKKTCDLCRNNSREVCVDTLPDCVRRAESGECSSNVELMFAKCPRTCDFCPGKSLPNKLCLDNNTICEYYKANNGCTTFRAKMSQYCPRSCGNCDNHYAVDDLCKDKLPDCFFAAWQGNCHSISSQCKLSCNICRGYDYVADPNSCKDKAEKFCSVMNIRHCRTSRKIRQLCTRRCRLCSNPFAWFHLPD